MSEKMHKFERLAEKRVNEAIKKLRLIGNLSNKNNYEYTDKHVKKVLEVLESEVRLLKMKFKGDELDSVIFKFDGK
jgi:hypothetical protein